MRSTIAAAVAIVAFRSPVLAHPAGPINSTVTCEQTSAYRASHTKTVLPPCNTCSPFTDTSYVSVDVPTESWPSYTVSPTPQITSTGLSLTQQLLLSETVADRFNILRNDSQFVFDFNQPLMGAGKGGGLIAANRKTFPALVGTSSGMAVGRVGPCGINTPHVHNRAAELQIVTEGRLITEMIPENGVLNTNGSRRVIVNEIGPYQMIPFYEGSIHTQYNPDCTNVTFIASFSNEDFGTGQVFDEIFDFTEDVVAAALGQAIAGEDIDSIRHAIPSSIALGVEECLQRCDMQKRAL